MQDRYEDPEPSPPPGMPQLALPSLTPVTKALLILLAGVFVLEFLLSLVFPGSELWLVRHLGLATADWRGLPPVWQLLTYGLLHDPESLWHLAGNLLILYFFGTMLEGILGSRRFLTTWVGAQLAGALLYLAIGIFADSPRFAIGASGATYGIMIATATLRPRQTVFLLFIPLTMRILAIGILILTVFGMLSSWKRGGDGVAHAIHFGGIAYGFLAVRTGWIWRDPMRLFEARRAIAQEERRASDEQRMDRILAKIHGQGMSTLSRSERAFLKRMARRRK